MWPNFAPANVTVLQRNISIGASGLCFKIAIAVVQIALLAALSTFMLPPRWFLVLQQLGQRSLVDIARLTQVNHGQLDLGHQLTYAQQLLLCVPSLLATLISCTLIVSFYKQYRGVSIILWKSPPVLFGRAYAASQVSSSDAFFISLRQPVTVNDRGKRSTSEREVRSCKTLQADALLGRVQL